jgi:hypothetical protein
MRPRAYVFSLLTLTVAFFFAVVGANLLLDPEAVLGTGVIGRPLNPNDRNLVMRAYEEAADSFDGLLFGSSRAGAIAREELGLRTGGVRFANFSVVFGQIIDHVAVLDYVIRSKAARGKALRSVFLLLDPDFLGDRQFSNRAIQTLWPPELTGESRWRFTWRYLTAIQFGTWRSVIAFAWSGKRTADMVPSRPGYGFGTIATMLGSAARAAEIEPGPSVAAADEPRESITARTDFERQLSLLAKFVALCDAHGIKLSVALPPLHRANAAQFADMPQVVDRITAIVPVWDFDSPRWLSERPDLWVDGSHFRPAVGTMMLDRMFGDGAPGVPKDFGVLRGRR